MQVTSLFSRKEHKHAHAHEQDETCISCGEDHSHAPVRLMQTLVGLLFVINAFIVDWLLEKGTVVASASAMIGAILLAYPIVVTALKDLRQGILSINELVAIAVLASFASGDYKTAGVVAFFMLMGNFMPFATVAHTRAVRFAAGG